MLLNEPSPHSTRPAAATAAAVPGTVELPAVEVGGALAPPRASAEADTVSFGAVDRNGNVSGAGSGGAARPGQDGETTSSADPEAGSDASAGSVSSTSAGADSQGAESAGEDADAGDGVSSGQSANADGGGRDATSTVALDVEAVKRAVAEGMAVSTPDTTSTVSLDVAAVKRATAAQAPTVAFAPVDVASVEAESAESGADELVTEPAAEAVTERADELSTEPADGAATELAAKAATELAAEAATEAAAEPGDELATQPADDPEPDSGGGSPAGTDRESASVSADLVPSSDSAPDATSAYLASTVLSTAASSVVAVPETADDVIATIHAAATAVAAADRRARQAAVVKEDPWTDLDLHRPAPPAPVGNVLDLLSPVLERPLLVVEQPGLPAAADVVALHRSELQQDFVEPPVVAAGAEPPIPPRYGPGLSVLPHIEFPV